MSERDAASGKPRGAPPDNQLFKALEILDDPRVLSLIFYPRADANPPPDDPRIKEYLFFVEDGIMIGARFFISKTEDPVIMLFHGNGEIAADYDDIAPLYLERGINLLVMDYRGYGRSNGTPSLSSMIRDASVLFHTGRQMLASSGFHGDLWVMGRSLGSASALEIARSGDPSIRGLIIESGFSNAVGLLQRLGIPWDSASVPEEAFGFNRLAISKVKVPTLIIHGQMDQIIPFSEGETLFRASAAARRELVCIPQAGHNDLLWLGLELYFESITRFVKGGDPQTDSIES